MYCACRCYCDVDTYTDKGVTVGKSSLGSLRYIHSSSYRICTAGKQVGYIVSMVT